MMVSLQRDSTMSDPKVYLTSYYLEMIGSPKDVVRFIIDRSTANCKNSHKCRIDPLQTWDERPE